ncbi:Olfactory receptor 7E24 [Heterocephalus glaber]|uniref:Olfactory receptor 7E24 n=1 Tax=Heterocephalus glaber TaxID=10181 RepID=G5BDS4_HETGA|nr:Olfactory receptor 7E24 [Heterocephalus glaber]
MRLSDNPVLQPKHFGLFLSLYLVMLRNLLIILALSSDSNLHTVKYSFLSNQSLADNCFSSTTVSKMIVDNLIQSRIISYVCCLSQMYFFIFFGYRGHMLLPVLGYDWFVAIWYNLHYPVIMEPCISVFLLLISFLVCIFDSQRHNMIALQLTCFKDVEIAKFFCEPSQLLHCTSSDHFTNSMYLIVVIFDFNPIPWSLYSDYKIVSSILKVPSSGGRHKAFSTCGIHLSVVCLFYGTGLAMYFSLTVSQFHRKCIVDSLIYTMVTCMLNPFIYTACRTVIRVVP